MPSGSCICGELKYKFEGEPKGMDQALCYCLSCRKISGGSHTVNLMVPQTDFRLTLGSEKTCNQRHETGMTLTLHFCGNCGGTIYKTADSEDFVGMAIVQAGTVDHPNSLLEETKPAMELFTKYRAPWVPALEGTVQKSEF